MAAEAFGSLCKGFIASFLTSTQMSTSLAWVFSPSITSPLCFSPAGHPRAPLRVRESGGGTWRGRFISAEFSLLKELVWIFFYAICKDEHIQGLVLHHSLHSHVLTPQLQTNPSSSLTVLWGQDCKAMAHTPVSKTCPLGGTWHTQPPLTMKTPKPGLENQSCDQDHSHHFPHPTGTEQICARPWLVPKAAKLCHSFVMPCSHSHQHEPLHPVPLGDDHDKPCRVGSSSCVTNIPVPIPEEKLQEMQRPLHHLHFTPKPTTENI